MTSHTIHYKDAAEVFYPGEEIPLAVRTYYEDKPLRVHNLYKFVRLFNFHRETKRVCCVACTEPRTARDLSDYCPQCDEGVCGDHPNDDDSDSDDADGDLNDGVCGDCAQALRRERACTACHGVYHSTERPLSWCTRERCILCEQCKKLDPLTDKQLCGCCQSSNNYCLHCKCDLGECECETEEDEETEDEETEDEEEEFVLPLKRDANCDVAGEPPAKRRRVSMIDLTGEE